MPETAADTQLGAAEKSADTQVVRTPPPAAIAAEDLLGLSRGAVSELLGRPSVVRSEAPAEIWQYRNRTCVVDLIFYGDGDAAVIHIEARDRAAAPLAADPCLAVLVRERHEAERAL